MAAHLLRDTFGMHPLTVTWRPHEYTDVGWRNFNTWLAQGFDNVLVTPNPRVHRLLTRLAFEHLGHPFQPFVLGQRSLGPKLAAAHGIGLVMFGEDDSEYEGEAGWQEKQDEPTALGDIRLGGVSVDALIRDHGLALSDLWIYLPMAPHTVECRALGNFVPWQPQAAYYFASERGFEANDERTEGTYSKYNSIDDRLDPLHYYLTWIKFGLGRASYDAAQEIRNGHLTRGEGINLARLYDGELRASTVQFGGEYMGISEAEFWAVITRLRRERPWLWREEGERWRLTTPIWESERR